MLSSDRFLHAINLFPLSLRKEFDSVHKIFVFKIISHAPPTHRSMTATQPRKIIGPTRKLQRAKLKSLFHFKVVITTVNRR